MKRETRTRDTKVSRGAPPEIKSTKSTSKSDKNTESSKENSKGTSKSSSKNTTERTERTETPKSSKSNAKEVSESTQIVQKQAKHKNETTMDLAFIRCSCSKVFNMGYRKVRVENEELIKQRMIELIDKGYTETQAADFLYENNLDMKHVMDKLGLNRICCRKTFMSDIVISFPRPDSEVAARLKKIIPELAEVEKNYLSGLSDKIRDKIIANSHKLDLPEPADLNPETELYTERLAEEDIGENYKIKSGFNVIGYESVGEGKYVEVLGASKLDNGLGVRTYLGR